MSRRAAWEAVIEFSPPLGAVGAGRPRSRRSTPVSPMSYGGGVGEALLIPFGLNLLSSAAFEVLATRLREYIWPKRRAFLSAVSSHVRRAAGVDLAPELLEHVLFDSGAFRAVLRRDPAPSSWDSLLFDLLQPGGPATGPDLARLLYEAVITQGGLDVPIALAEGISDLKDGQAAIYEELVRLRSLLERESIASGEPPTVHRSITDHLSRVHTAIDELTAEQLHVIRTLHGVRRALIPGAAGSGKTIVACEKAMRLADAGLKTLLLCHNPWLARHLEEMTKASLVEVHPFGDWVAAVAGQAARTSAQWQRHEEPPEELLWAALERLLDAGTSWQAVIVDEGQDFRTSWWLLVDAAVDAGTGLLYVFADDHQRLHGADRQYPGFDQTYTLSRNCRNSGHVYAAMRGLVPGLARHEHALADVGTAVVVFGVPGAVPEALGLAARELQGTSDNESVVVLTMDGQVEAVRAANLQVFTQHHVNWRRGVSAATRRVVEEARSHSWYVPGAADDCELLSPLSGLSHDVVPSQNDAELVAEVARVLIARTPKLDWSGTSSPVRFVVTDTNVVITRAAPRYWHARVKYLASGAWTADIPSPPALNLKPYSAPAPARLGNAAVHTVAGFKGLEADTVLVVWEPRLSPDPLAELYVAISRARVRSIVVAPWTARTQLPPRLLQRVRVIDTSLAAHDTSCDVEPASQ